MPHALADVLAIGVVWDRSELKRRESEHDAVRSREFLDAILNAIRFPIFVKDAQHRWGMLNDEALQDLGLDRAVLTGKPDSLVLDPELVRESHEQHQEALAISKEIVKEMRTHFHATERWNLRHKTAVTVDAQSYVVSCVLNVDVLKRAQKALRPHQAKLEEIVATRTSELRLAKEAAEAASKAKGQFLAEV